VSRPGPAGNWAAASCPAAMMVLLNDRSLTNSVRQSTGKKAKNLANLICVFSLQKT
jgi:hypothetical protein